MYEPGAGTRIYFEDDQLRFLHHLVLDATGNLYTASDHDAKIWKIDPDGDLTLFFDGTTLSNDGLAFVGRGGDPFTLDHAGRIYTLDRGSTQQILLVGDTGGVTPLRPEWRAGATLHYSTMRFAGDTLYVTDRSRVWRFPPNGAPEALADSADDIRFGYGLAVAPDGTVYVSDIDRAVVHRRDPITEGWSVVRPRGLKLVQPVAVATGADGSLYIKDQVSSWNTLWVVTPDGAEKLYSDVNLLALYAPWLLLWAFQIVLILRTWERKPKNRLDWTWWTTMVGAVVTIAWLATSTSQLGAQVVRHVFPILFLYAAWRSGKRTTKDDQRSKTVEDD